jgi:hypothetical protein
MDIEAIKILDLEFTLPHHGALHVGYQAGVPHPPCGGVIDLHHIPKLFAYQTPEIL